MYFGYRHYEEQDGFYQESGWGKGSPVKIGLSIEFDSLAFWRKVPHKHIPERYGSSILNWPKDSIVNARCERCLRWIVIATGKLHNELNKRDNE